MAEHDTLRDALQQMVDAFTPYAWGSIDNKRDALNAATEALASPPVAVQEEGDAKDAARYRWLRDQQMPGLFNPQFAMYHLTAWKSPADIDAAIDAMKGDQP